MLRIVCNVLYVCCPQDEQWTEALSACGSALELQRDARVLCDRGDALLGLDMFDDGTYSCTKSQHTM